MAIESLIAGALAVMANEAFREDPLKKANAESAARVREYMARTGLAIPDCEMKDVWFKELTYEIEDYAEALDKLYEAIQYCPTNGNEDWPCFELDKKRPKPGITEIRKDYKTPNLYVINFIAGHITVGMAYDTSADFNFRPEIKKVESTLKSIRTKYWLPNEQNWKQWVRLAMKVQGASDLDIKIELENRKIPLNCPANDIVYRTEAELKWFDKVADRIYKISEQMLTAAQNWANLLHRGWPSDTFMNRRNYMSWNMYMKLLS